MPSAGALSTQPDPLVKPLSTGWKYKKTKPMYIYMILLLSDKLLPYKLLPDKLLPDKLLPDKLLPDKLLPDKCLNKSDFC
jgi:hypothetical protein